jgi:hypothetical protein
LEALRLIGIAVVYIVLLLGFGWLIATIAFVSGALIAGGKTRPLAIATVTAGLTLTVWAIFDRLLAIPWPRPIVFGWLGIV